MFLIRQTPLHCSPGQAAKLAELSALQVVYMGEIDTERQKLNCFRLSAFGLERWLDDMAVA